jgi:hypothetical protein
MSPALVCSLWTAATTTTTTTTILLAAATFPLVSAAVQQGLSSAVDFGRRPPPPFARTAPRQEQQQQHLTPTLSVPRGGDVGGGGRGAGVAAKAAAAKNPRRAAVAVAKAAKASGPATSRLLPAWFRPGRPLRERQLSAALLVWSALAMVDAVRFTFDLEDNLRGYFVAQHQALHPQVVVMTRFLANCQWAYLATSVLVALTSSNVTVLKAAFGIAIMATLGAFRAVAMGIQDGVVQSPWKSQYASLLTVPPLLLLSYFAFWF